MYLHLLQFFDLRWCLARLARVFHCRGGPTTGMLLIVSPTTSISDGLSTKSRLLLASLIRSGLSVQQQQQQQQQATRSDSICTRQAGIIFEDERIYNLLVSRDVRSEMRNISHIAMLYLSLWSSKEAPLSARREGMRVGTM